jgi:PKD repeat protein
MRENSCGLDLPDRPDRPRNFMDYMNDIASTHFTPGQLQRMEAALTTQSLDQRYPLWQDQNLQETGAGPYKRPTAVMAATNQETHTGGYVHFLNFSRNAPDTFRWEFEGGMPATSSKASPKVRYDSAGSYDVTFIVGNSQGEFDTLTQKNYVSVKDTVYELPLEESFESNFTTLPSDWYLINTDRVGPKNKLGWEPTALAGANGSNRSVAMYCSQYTMIGERDGLVTPPLNFGSLDSAAISFSVAYAPFNNTDLDNPYTYTDSLALYASQDGGASWSKLYQKGGKNLAANGQAINKDQFDNPTADQWLRDTLNLNALTGEGPVLLKFEAINGWGNNIYLDEIKIEELDYQPDTSSADSSEDTTSRMHASAPATRIQLYPNPVRSATQLKLQMAERQAVSYQVLDINGRVVASQSLGPVGRGTSEHRISTAALSPGVYTIRIQAGREPHVRQLVKY